MSLFTILTSAGAVIFGLMILLWMISLVLHNSSIVDIFWGAGFVLTAWVYFLLTPDGFLTRKIVVAVLASIWGLRLTLHILTRNWGKAEDFRYQKWRKESGRIWWIKSLFQVFILQGLLMWVISVPLLAAQYPAQPSRLTLLDGLAIGLWVIGFFFESMGDLQLARFLKNPLNKGKILSSGVWRFFTSPKLLRGFRSMVGLFSFRPRRRSLVVDFQSNPHDLLAGENIGRCFAGENA